MSTSKKKIGVLVPQTLLAEVKARLVDIENVVSWKFFPITRDSTVEDVTLACLPAGDDIDSPQQQQDQKQDQQDDEFSCDGFLNLCNGRRSDKVSAIEVVDTLTELRVPFYSGPNSKVARYSRKEVAALAFYAAEDVAGIKLPCHAVVRSTQQRFYESRTQEIEAFLKTGNNHNDNNNHSNNNNDIVSMKQTQADEMVDKLRFPVLVRPLKYSHQQCHIYSSSSSSSLQTTQDKEMIIANSLKERIVAQRYFFSRGSSAVFVEEDKFTSQEQQEEEEEEEKSVEVLSFAIGKWNSAQNKSVVEIYVFFPEEDKSEIEVKLKDKKQQILKLTEILYRGIFDDATCCSPLHGHCLFRFRGTSTKKTSSGSVASSTSSPVPTTSAAAATSSSPTSGENKSSSEVPTIPGSLNTICSSSSSNNSNSNSYNFSYDWTLADVEPNCSLFPCDTSVATQILKKDFFEQQNQKQEEEKEGETDIAFKQFFSRFLFDLVELPNNNNYSENDIENNNEKQAEKGVVSFFPKRFTEPLYRVEYDPRYDWYGMCASRDIQKNEIVFADEATTFTLVTKPFVEKNWNAQMKEVFSRYAWPVDTGIVSGTSSSSSSSSSQKQEGEGEAHVYAIWSEDPEKWRPINHHCDPNIIFAAPHSLNCVASRFIKKGETLTLDYATFCDFTMKPFECKCGAESCRGMIEPTKEALAKYGENAFHRVPPKRPVATSSCSSMKDL